MSQAEIKQIVRGAHSNQLDMALVIEEQGRVIACLDFSEYLGQISVQMVSVDVEWRRKGLATRLLLALQQTYSDTEISLGFATADGAAWIDSLQSVVKPSEHAENFALLAEKQLELEQFEAKSRDYWDRCNAGQDVAQEMRAWHEKNGARWNDLRDTVEDLQRDLYGKRPIKRIFSEAASVTASCRDSAQEKNRRGWF